MVEPAAILLTLGAVGPPIALLIMLGALSLVDRPAPERVTGPATRWTFLVALLSFAALTALMLASGTAELEIRFGAHLVLRLDWLSLPFLGLTLMLSGVVGAFSHRYMHLEPGYNRFFVMLSLLAVGFSLTVLSGSPEVLVAGWELVGVSSALLIAFFHDRPMPVHNAMRTWVTYRVTDVGLLTAAVLMVHGGDATAIGALILLAAAGKSAMVPFSGWLPRAMEGPTPSSAIFYGALSVHAGAFLLLRESAYLDAAPAVAAAAVALGVVTAVHGTMAERVQTDVKSALAYASLTQVGIIVAEIGLGLRVLPVVHAVGHACLRSLQILRAPSLLHDLRHVEETMGERAARRTGFWERVTPPAARRWFYRLSLERFHFDALLDRCVVAPFLGAMRALDAADRTWASILRGSGR